MSDVHIATPEDIRGRLISASVRRASDETRSQQPDCGLAFKLRRRNSTHSKLRNQSRRKGREPGYGPGREIPGLTFTRSFRARRNKFAPHRVATLGCATLGCRRAHRGRMPDNPKITDYVRVDTTSGRELTDEELLNDIRRVERITGERPTLSSYDEYGTYSESAVYNHFDSWMDALDRAGVQEKGRKHNRIPDEELLGDIRRVAQLRNSPPRKYDPELKYAHGTYYNRFGSWTAALNKAGVDPDEEQLCRSHTEPVVERHSIQELVSDILDLAVTLDRPPYEHEFREYSSLPSSIVDRLAGTWSEALNLAGLPRRKRGGLMFNGNSTTRTYGRNWEKKRNQALTRDRYRCQDCGLTEQEHRDQFGRGLEVHHIKPIRSFDVPENGNLLENLITLCNDCHEKWEPVTQSDFSEQGGLY